MATVLDGSQRKGFLYIFTVYLYMYEIASGTAVRKYCQSSAPSQEAKASVIINRQAAAGGNIGGMVLLLRH